MEERKKEREREREKTSDNIWTSESVYAWREQGLILDHLVGH